MNEYRFREATEDDLPTIVAMLADDPLGATRESPHDLTPYLTAFQRLHDDPHQHLVVAERTEDGAVAGTLQLTVIPGLSRQGASRAQIEGVRVHAADRGTGLGSRLITWSVAEARRLGCTMVQLTSDVTREDAHRFYERLGFEATHVGFKQNL